MIGSMPVSWKTSNCDAASSKTLVNPNFSTARFRVSFGGWRVTCVGTAGTISASSCDASGGSTARKRSGSSFWAIGGRRRRKTWKSDAWGCFGDILLNMRTLKSKIQKSKQANAAKSTFQNVHRSTGRVPFWVRCCPDNHITCICIYTRFSVSNDISHIIK